MPTCYHGSGGACREHGGARAGGCAAANWDTFQRLLHGGGLQQPGIDSRPQEPSLLQDSSLRFRQSGAAPREGLRSSQRQRSYPAPQGGSRQRGSWCREKQTAPGLSARWIHREPAPRRTFRDQRTHGTQRVYEGGVRQPLPRSSLPFLETSPRTPESPTCEHCDSTVQASEVHQIEDAGF